MLLIGLLLAALAGLVLALRAPRSPRSGVSPAQVWSAEHGHWHDTR